MRLQIDVFNATKCWIESAFTAQDEVNCSECPSASYFGGRPPRVKSCVLMQLAAAPLARHNAEFSTRCSNRLLFFEMQCRTDFSLKPFTRNGISIAQVVSTQLLVD